MDKWINSVSWFFCSNSCWSEFIFLWFAKKYTCWFFTLTRYIYVLLFQVLFLTYSGQVASSIRNCMQECNKAPFLWYIFFLYVHTAYVLFLIRTFFLDVMSGETAKWEKITYAGIIACTTLAFYNLSKGHPHHEEPPVSYSFSQFIFPSTSQYLSFTMHCTLICVPFIFVLFSFYAGISLFTHTQ